MALNRSCGATRLWNSKPMRSEFVRASLALLLVQAAFASPQTPQPVEDTTAAPYAFTGVVGTYESWGSGVAAVDPKVVLSCAHVVFSADAFWWTSGARWYGAWNGDAEPVDSEGVALDGYFYWSSYASSVRSTSIAYSEFREAREFNHDFVAYYRAGSPVAGGSHAMAWTNGSVPLATPSTAKLVTGYPMGRYGEEDPLRFRMHETPIAAAMQPAFRSLPNYLTVYDVAETGSGNSGGPVWTQDSDGQMRVAGILVSGQETTLPDPEENWDRSMVGVHAISSAGWRLIRAALQASGKTTIVKSFPTLQGTGPIPEGKTLMRSFRVSGMPVVAADITLDLDIANINPQDRRDLYITLRSPGRRTIVVYDGAWEESDPDGPQISFPLNEEPTAYYYGVNPNGVWTLAIRDKRQNGVTSNFVSAALNVAGTK